MAARKKKETNGFTEYKKLFLHQFSEHSKAIGLIAKDIRRLHDDVITLKTEAKIEAKEEAKKESVKGRVMSIFLAGLVSAAIAFAF